MAPTSLRYNKFTHVIVASFCQFYLHHSKTLYIIPQSIVETELCQLLQSAIDEYIP